MSRTFGSRAVEVVTFVGALLLIAAECIAQNFPSKPIHFVVPYGAGGSPDVMARVIARMLARNVAQPVVVDNRPGAGGIIAAEFVAKAAADGYTLFIADTGHVAINPSLYPKLPYDPLRDFTPVTMAASGPYYMAVNAGLPVHSVKELIAYAKANPGLPYGSSGNGSAHHLGMELFRLLAGVSMTHVPFKGVAQSVPAVVSGDVAVILAGLPSLAPHAKAGKVRIIGFTKAKRAAVMPDTPTIAEAGVPGYELDTGMGFLAPAGTPAEVIAKLNSELVKVLRVPETAQQLVALGIDPIGSSPQEYGEKMRAWIQKYSKLVRDVGAKVD